MKNALQVERVNRNFYRIRVAPRSTTVREWEKLDASQIFVLLRNSSPNARPQARQLLNQMATTKWTLMATAHDNGSNKQDDPLHITVRIGKRKAHHLYCRDIRGTGLQIFRIT